MSEENVTDVSSHVDVTSWLLLPQRRLQQQLQLQQPSFIIHWKCVRCMSKRIEIITYEHWNQQYHGPDIHLSFLYLWAPPAQGEPAQVERNMIMRAMEYFFGHLFGNLKAHQVSEIFTMESESEIVVLSGKCSGILTHIRGGSTPSFCNCDHISPRIQRVTIPPCKSKMVKDKTPRRSFLGKLFWQK